jgi:tetratricopeptide (TPR) repeat protein
MLSCAAVLSATTVGAVRAGTKLYNQGTYDRSLAKYREAQISSPDSTAVNFDIGDALYKTNNFDEAALAYQKTLAGKDRKFRAATYYNLGNTAYRKGNTAEAITCYKKALEINPGDRDAKYNIEYLLSQPKKKDQKNGQGKDNKQQNGKGNDQDKSNSNGRQQQSSGTANKGMSKEDAARILQVFNERDQESAKHRKMSMPQIPKTDEDW